MANTFSQLYLHVVFSTKNRIDLIRPEIENRVWKYLGGIARNHKMTAIQVGGIENHVHALLGIPTTVSPSQAAQYLKGGSSAWIHQEFSDLKKFAWQDGYGIFSVSKRDIPAVVKYIHDQREHHKTETFEKEYIRLLQLHDIEYDERYLFG